MKYPAITYSFDGYKNIHADDDKYYGKKRYSVILIDKDPDNVTVDKLNKLPYASFGRHYRSDNLNHYTFTIYY